VVTGAFQHTQIVIQRQKKQSPKTSHQMPVLRGLAREGHKAEIGSAEVAIPHSKNGLSRREIEKKSVA